MPTCVLSQSMLLFRHAQLMALLGLLCSNLSLLDTYYTLIPILRNILEYSCLLVQLGKFSLLKVLVVQAFLFEINIFKNTSPGRSIENNKSKRVQNFFFK